jgi:hypothetical protein
MMGHQEKNLAINCKRRIWEERRTDHRFFPQDVYKIHTVVEEMGHHYRYDANSLTATSSSKKTGSTT